MTHNESLAKDKEIVERINLLLADGWTQMGNYFYKDELVIKQVSPIEKELG